MRFDGFRRGGGGVGGTYKKPAFSHELLWHPEIAWISQTHPTYYNHPSFPLSLLLPKITPAPKGGSFFCWVFKYYTVVLLAVGKRERLGRSLSGLTGATAVFRCCNGHDV